MVLEASGEPTVYACAELKEVSLNLQQYNVQFSTPSTATFDRYICTYVRALGI